MGTNVQRLTDIDLSELQLGEKLTIYRGSGAFLTGPQAAGYVGDATVIDVKKRGALLSIPKAGDEFIYRLRFKDARICRIPNGETTALYVHARGGRPQVTAYLTNDEYVLVKLLLSEEAQAPATPRRHRLSLSALERMQFHDDLRRNGERT
jgi:hypothetical protein